MVAAKEKMLRRNPLLTQTRISAEPSRQPATTKPQNQPTTKTNAPTVINRISNYDFTARKFQKPPIGTSEKIRCIVLVEFNQQPRKYTGENAVELRRLHRAPELSLYRGYFVPAGVDPGGAITVTPAGEQNTGKCGDLHYLQWTFRLDNKAPCDGFVVQQVDVRCTNDKCNDCPDTSPTEPDFTYWEAWEYKKDDDVDVDFNKFGFTDRAWSTPSEDEEGTCGNLSQIGTIKFFCKNAADVPNGAANVGTGDLNTNWNPGQYGEGDCKVTTGDLVSTGVKPMWWDNQPVEGPAHRNWGIFWSCCPDCPEFVFVTGSPR